MVTVIKSRTKIPKQALRRDAPFTCPPRLDAKVKSAMMNPVRKPKVLRTESKRSGKKQGLTEKQRKDYQLTSRRSK